MDGNSEDSEDLEFDEDLYKELVLAEIAREVAQSNRLALEKLQYNVFVSWSNGKRKRRRKYPREIRLVTWRNKTRAIGNKLTRELEFLMQDVFPEIMAEYSGSDWLEAFVQALREMPKKEGKGKEVKEKKRR